MQSDFEIIELKIYAPDGEVLYCSDTEDIGEVNQHTYFHQIVAKGHKYTKLVPKMSKSSENKTLNSDVVETYIPIMRDGKFAGAFEIYYDVTLKKELLTDLVSRSSIMVIILSIIFMAMSLFIYLRNRKEYSISNTLDNYLEQHKYMSIYLFVITMATVFISEFFIMVMLDRIKKNLSISSELLLNFMDSLILVFVLYPIMYFFVFKPLLIQITERKQMAEFLRVAEKEWDTIFNSISDMISVHGVDFSIKRVNNAFLNFYGVTHKDVIGKKCYEIVHDSTHPFNDCPHLRCIQSKIPEVQEILDENISVPVLESVSPVFDEQGNLTSSVHIAKDITHIKKVEMELKEKAIQLQHLNENLQVLVSEEIEKHRQKEQMQFGQQGFPMRVYSTLR
ncbi:PAS domain-containing protein [Candidatus Magnetomonas plexicatena]|uniref:PAS domain-containing protein n=1 Tax=Candidatus Magnetomonas plexicatena TaxID=2552947 RepID=UPI004032DA97